MACLSVIGNCPSRILEPEHKVIRLPVASTEAVALSATAVTVRESACGGTRRGAAIEADKGTTLSVNR